LIDVEDEENWKEASKQGSRIRLHRLY
jgi:hypothetical protein